MATRASAPETARLLVIGISHRTAPVAIRERLAITPRLLPDSLAALRRLPGVNEVVLLSTCNRVEYYVRTSEIRTAVDALLGWIGHAADVSPGHFASFLYVLADAAAAAHLFRVTAGLDSMILGESEITAQVKQAYAAAQAVGATGPWLDRAFQKALHAAKVIRTRTAIGTGQASIGSVVARLAARQFGSALAGCEVLLWGAGKAAEVTARHLMKAGVSKLWIVNRTKGKAADLATLCQGRCVSSEQAMARLAHADIAVVCTQAPHYVIDADDLAAARATSSRPLLLLDLSVPRNVDPAIATHRQVTLYNIDDLNALTLAGRTARTQAVSACHDHVDAQVAHLRRWWQFAAQKEAVSCQLAAA